MIDNPAATHPERLRALVELENEATVMRPWPGSDDVPLPQPLPQPLMPTPPIARFYLVKQGRFK